MQLHKKYWGLEVTELGNHLTPEIGSTVSLKNGEKVGYLEFGDPNGKPIFYFHGAYSSRIEAGAFAFDAAKNGIRLIALDRPGIGLSDNISDFTFLDWTDIVIEVADILNIERFSVCGVSGGGAFACACGVNKTLANRLNNIILIAAMVPAKKSEKKKQLKSARALFTLCRVVPYVSGLILNALYNQNQVNKSIQNIQAYTENKSEEHIEYSKKIIECIMIKSMSSSKAQGQQGNVRDLGLYSLPQGFNLADINTPVLIFSGIKDINAPYVISKRISQEVPYGELVSFADCDHFSIFNYSNEIFKKIGKFITNN